MIPKGILDGQPTLYFGLCLKLNVQALSPYNWITVILKTDFVMTSLESHTYSQTCTNIAMYVHGPDRRFLYQIDPTRGLNI